jgi:YtoQ family protein
VKIDVEIVHFSDTKVAVIEHCDLEVVGFGNKYKQWNAVFYAGYCAAMGTPYITLYDEDIMHLLKEVGWAAMAWAATPDQLLMSAQ